MRKPELNHACAPLQDNTGVLNQRTVSVLRRTTKTEITEEVKFFAADQGKSVSDSVERTPNGVASIASILCGCGVFMTPLSTMVGSVLSSLGILGPLSSSPNLAAATTGILTAATVWGAIRAAYSAAVYRKKRKRTKLESMSPRNAPLFSDTARSGSRKIRRS